MARIYVLVRDWRLKRDSEGFMDYDAEFVLFNKKKNITIDVNDKGDIGSGSDIRYYIDEKEISEEELARLVPEEVTNKVDHIVEEYFDRLNEDEAREYN